MAIALEPAMVHSAVRAMKVLPGNIAIFASEVAVR
jgi:hypothetical protein